MTEDPDAPELVSVRDAEPLARTAAELHGLDTDAPRVAIVVAARGDLLTMERAETELGRYGIRSETRVMAAHLEVVDYTENAQLRGIRVIIAGTGPNAPLAALVAGHTRLPVIGVPLTHQGATPEALGPLLHGEPVGWVALDDAVNAAALAARILGL